MKESQKDKILTLMLERFPGWVRNTELNADICFRYGARIYDLKKEGWEIENIPVPNTKRQVWQCRLLKPFNPQKPFLKIQNIPKIEIFQQKQQSLILR
jgi:hypothetical protein